ncbi:MAG: Malate-2H(+)/Na(+)-lactate antiporter [Candidatus Moanabacter tarae]|uniref:Malate-2H(+)/Na(+)-lactate antiporter n=1 Tax=Candidatus Moanibacter tarae TaxID=2200854 RepID=A0A2Z4AG67_9BACT|nr:MAG: Malate-2H(+)/Na(+)-lactate antiporter [Candidatus Moanabacter tarae]
MLYYPTFVKSHKLRLSLAWVLWGSCFFFAKSDIEIRAIWPSVIALGLVLLIRRVLTGLMAGGAAGVVILEGGDLLSAFAAFFSEHLVPSLQDSWKVGALIFTLLLGGFVSLVERGGGFNGLVTRFLLRGKHPARRLQWTTMVVGLVLFFDGLANSMLVGRMMRSLADFCGVSRVKLAYIVDSTSSTVACVAFVSTWIATQLAMIREGYVMAGRAEEAAPYALFFESIPFNFYCLFTLILLAVSIRRNFNPGAMGCFEGVDREEDKVGQEHRIFLGGDDEVVLDEIKSSHWVRAILPIFVLVASLLFGVYLVGTEQAWPITAVKLVGAFGSDQVVNVLLWSSALASLIAFSLYPRGVEWELPSVVFLEGVKALFVPVLILVGAWILSSTLTQLQAAEVISSLLGGHLPIFAIPASVFLLGALISFSTGSAWGTMIILMPLAVTLLFGLSGDAVLESERGTLAAVVGAVFSGAVFGDHCSPISDTTIVSSIACEVEPHDHVRTQLPYALIAAFAALILGFLPVGFGLSPWISLLLGLSVLPIVPTIFTLTMRPQ